MPTLSNRIALVTGASSGIGKATAELLVSHGVIVFGADLEATGGESVKTGRVLDSGVIELPLDVREEKDWESVVGHVMETQGRLDILVHGAGISSASPLPETSLEEWRHVIATNLDGSFLAIKHGIRAMVSVGGAIVVIGSASGIRPAPGAVAYSTSKAAVGMLVRAAAKECKSTGVPVRINAVSPAGVRTPMWGEMPFFQELIRLHGTEEKAFAAMEAESGERFAEAEDIAQSIAFLVSDAANQINGVELPIDGGYVL